MITLSDIEREHPLLPMQRGMLFHSLIDVAAYVCQTVATLEGAIDCLAFERAWRHVIGRHEALRTSFHWDGYDEPIQRVHGQVPFRIVEHDWADVGAADRQSRIDAFLADDRRRVFDATEPPVMRCALLRCSAARAVFVWTHHHALLDGRSRVVVLNEIAVCYDAFRRGHDPALPAVRPFHEYVAWWREQDRSGAREHWSGVLRDFTPPSSISTTLATGEHGRADAFEAFTVPLSETSQSAVRKLARRKGITPNLVVQAAWAILVSRYGGARDVVFGETRACRRAAFEGSGTLVGLVMNTVPIRVRLAATATCDDLFDQLRAQHVALRKYESTSLAEIQTWSRVEVGELLDTVVVFEEAALDAAVAPDATLWRSGVRRVSTSHYPLTLEGYNRPELSLSLRCDGRVVSAAATRLCGHLATLLDAIIAGPTRPIDELPLLTPDERARLVEAGRGPAPPAAAERCVHQLFAAQARRTPEATAVVMGADHLSYRALDRRANRFARYLRRQGVGADVRVAVDLERSIDGLIAILAILKAGGAYVPLDRAQPRARVASLLHDADVRLVITDAAGREAAPPSGAAVLCLHECAADIAAESDAPLPEAGGPANLAYVMYTSGSTGVPKGVAVSHRGIVRLVADVSYVDLGPAETILQLAPLGFDASTFEIWGALLRGGRLVLYPGAVPELDALETVVESAGVSCVWLTASLFNLIVDTAPGVLRGVRQILTGGEALSVAHVQRAQARLPHARLINGYGPTEATTFTCCYGIPRPLPDTRSIPIGTPIPHTDVLVVDATGALAPVGVPGELFVAGAGLARAYLNQPDRTAAAFVPVPFEIASGTRMYATGDWVRWLEAGVLQFLGRRDTQVKIRGFRIEPGEVEAALRRLDLVADAAVIVDERPDGKRLVAFVAPRHAPPAEDSAVGVSVRARLLDALPEYMVPAIVVVEELPRTGSGKVDRLRLLQHAGTLEVSPTTAVAPRTAVEAVVAATLGEVVGREALGVEEDFFAAGGHSLAAMRAAALLRRRLAVEVPVRLLFEAPTAGQLAARLEQERRAAEPGIPVVRRDGPLPLSFATAAVNTTCRWRCACAGRWRARRCRRRSRSSWRAMKCCARGWWRWRGGRSSRSTRRRWCGCRSWRWRAWRRRRARRWRRGRGAPRRGGRSRWRASRCCASGCCGWRRPSTC
jgi:surfactin family lipopeptide synthetase C